MRESELTLIPFHYYMLGVGMLAEDRFPSAAFVSGDIDRFQAEKARDKIRAILKRDVNLPLCRVQAFDAQNNW